MTVVPDHPDPSEWQIEAGVTCVACPDCAFTFDAVHIDQNGGYSCPSCAEARQAADLSRLREERDALTTLAMSFFDPSPCSFDHHGGCQNHTFLDLEPGELCPNEQLRRLPPVAPSPDPNGGEQ